MHPPAYGPGIGIQGPKWRNCLITMRLPSATMIRSSLFTESCRQPCDLGYTMKSLLVILNIGH